MGRDAEGAERVNLTTVQPVMVYCRNESMYTV